MATKTKKVPSNRVFMFVTTSMEYDAGDYSVAAVDITPKYAKELLKKIELIRKLRKTLADNGDSLYEMYYWDRSARYAENEDALSSNPDSSGSPTECDQLAVRADEVQWCAYIKHSDNVEIRTANLGYDFLKARAAGKE